jgi:hypothetical protein
MSQTPAEVRHTVPLALNASDGHPALVPVHFSATSQTPALDRHSVPEATNAFAGQYVLVPLQVSATSQTPAAERHVAPALPAGCWQVTLVPLHWSSVHGL